MSTPVTAVVEREDGSSEEVTIDLAEPLTMRESVWLEDIVGGETFDKIAAGNIPMRPSVLRALLFVKLRSKQPDVNIDSFDVSFDDIDAVDVNTDPKEV